LTAGMLIDSASIHLGYLLGVVAFWRKSSVCGLNLFVCGQTKRKIQNLYRDNFAIRCRFGLDDAYIIR
jgi:hypothetical protein